MRRLIPRFRLIRDDRTVLVQYPQGWAGPTAVPPMVPQPQRPEPPPLDAFGNDPWLHMEETTVLTREFVASLLARA